ncbi:hypothetical protein AAZX31_11G208100 [Glycine max]|nr:hypothetical protein GYH30_031663 [Glycine max]
MLFRVACSADVRNHPILIHYNQGKGDSNHLVLAHLFGKPCFLRLLAVQIRSYDDGAYVRTVLERQFFRTVPM